MITPKILIVDDDPATCGLLETVFQMENYQAASILDLVQVDMIFLLNEVRPQILILDFHLKSKTTLEYVTLIRNNPDWRHLPILMTSAIDRRQDCLKAGANDFILKPFSWDEMLKTVNKIRDELI
jgi:DNA-binding response OmpR family regulator